MLSDESEPHRPSADDDAYAQATGVLIARHDVPAVQAEMLLLTSAARLGVDLHELARVVIRSARRADDKRLSG